MKSSTRLVCSLVIILSFLPALCAQDKPEKVDLETISRIRYEGFHNSKVMDLASGLMDSIGERLTGSPNMKRANEWTRDQLTAMGLSNSHLEPWGPFGRGWANQYVNARMTVARHRPAARLRQSLDARHQRRRHRQMHSREHRKKGRLRQVQGQARRNDRHRRPRRRRETHHRSSLQALHRRRSRQDRRI